MDIDTFTSDPHSLHSTADRNGEGAVWVKTSSAAEVDRKNRTQETANKKHERVDTPVHRGKKLMGFSMQYDHDRDDNGR